MVFARGRADQVLAGLEADGQRCDLVVLDPPRAGAKGLMARLAALEPRRVIYVSCHAATLARDAAQLAARGYVPRDLCVVDLFPQTAHLEAVLVLDRERD